MLDKKNINKAYHQDEIESVDFLLKNISFTHKEKKNIEDNASLLVKGVRDARLSEGGIDAFLYQYDLSSEEGIALMCIAEAMLRIPDSATRDKLIKDKLTQADWAAHLGASHSLFVNAATWGLMITGKVLSPKKAGVNKIKQALSGLVGRTGAPVIRSMVNQAMKIMGEQFVMGRTIDEGLKRAKPETKKGYRFSFDMLGEAARTAKDARRYFDAYKMAIDKIGQQEQDKSLHDSASISIKLSALHPRYEYSQKQRVLAELAPTIKQLALQAKQHNIGLTIDAEEAERLDLSLDIFRLVYEDTGLDNWPGFGLAVQAYQKRASYVIDWLVELAGQIKRRIPVRLVKGAYWDSEIKHAQELDLQDYPVYTQKVATDVSYLVCAKKMLQHTEQLYCQFATHNANTLAAVFEMADGYHDYEFQCLHGMGNALYDQVVDKEPFKQPCRVYAPVGIHEDLLPYLVRRLLENGANTSFVNRIVDKKLPLDMLVVNHLEKLKASDVKRHPSIPLPRDLFGDKRRNSLGLDLSDDEVYSELKTVFKSTWQTMPWQAKPIVKDSQSLSSIKSVFAPADRSKQVGAVQYADSACVEQALMQANDNLQTWRDTPVETRAECLEKTADLLEQHCQSLMAILIQEAGKTIPDALAEVREAIDFCRYYAVCAREQLAELQRMPGPTGEENYLKLVGRGPTLCISPWNFPLAIFLGQITAALVAGNPVIAKPAEQTPYIAYRAVELLKEAGIPEGVIQLLPGEGDIAEQCVKSEVIKTVMFTGSTEVAKRIQLNLAQRQGPIATLIAETGGLNAMLVDSSALLEQVVDDVIISAFGSAGQRCSALRVAYIQEDIADKFIAMLRGAMQELSIDEPGLLSTDVGPVIDADALALLEKHKVFLDENAKLIGTCTIDKLEHTGYFFAPCAYELENIKQLKREVFGPILHVIRYAEKDLPSIVNEVNQLGYGLTLGIHSRIDNTVDYITARVNVGNVYVNRNIIGAVVGVQPFGGEGLSGTGPKAGGPHYLVRLCTERTVTINTTAAGGNASLMTLET